VLTSPARLFIATRFVVRYNAAMHYNTIDHISLLTPDVAASTTPFRRLGVTVAPSPFCTAVPATPAVGEEAVFVGHEHNLFAIHFQSSAAVSAAALRALTLAVTDLRASLAHLARHGVHGRLQELHNTDGVHVADAAHLSGSADAGVDLILVQYVRPASWRYTDLHHRGLLHHGLPLRRLDHLAIVSPSLDARSRYWSDTLGVPLVGEVKTPTLHIRQHKIGDAVVELLGAAGPDSPIHERRPGLVSMVSLEVTGLDHVAGLARKAGFHPSEPVTGPLTGTRISTLPADEMGGLSVQLLEYLDLRGESLAGPGALA
jgi:catechol 2,3-dioxygenase-like lactoylglutathione lyase family enzyme